MERGPGTQTRPETAALQLPAGSPQELDKARKDRGPADTLLLDFQPPELREDTFLLF